MYGCLFGRAPNPPAGGGKGRAISVRTGTGRHFNLFAGGPTKRISPSERVHPGGRCYPSRRVHAGGYFPLVFNVLPLMFKMSIYLF